MSELKVERKLNLDPRDYLCVTYKPRPEVPLPKEPKKFNLEEELKRFDAFVKDFNKGHYYFDWPEQFNREQSRFWMTALKDFKTVPLDKIKTQLKNMSFDEPVLLQEVFDQRKQDANGKYDSAYCLILFADCSIQRFFDILNKRKHLCFLMRDQYFLPTSLPKHFRKWILPIIGEAELVKLREILRPETLPEKAPKKYEEPFRLLQLAALCGMHSEMEAIIEAQPDESTQHPHHNNKFLPMIFGLGSREAVIHHTKRLGQWLTNSGEVRAWLAHTGWEQLDLAMHTINFLTSKSEVEPLLITIAIVDVPELAPFILEQWQDGKAPAIAGDWLRDHPGNAIAGVLPLAHGSSKLANAAVEFLREMKRKGHADFIAEQLADVDDAVKKHVQEQVLDHEEKEYPMLADADMPKDLQQEFASYKIPAKSTLPKWLDVAALPPIIVQDAKLGSDNVLSLLHCLKNAPGKAEPDLLKMLRQHAQPQAMDAFVWKLFETWQREGMPSKEKWCFIAVGLFGSDASALKLTSLIREWPGMSKHQSAVTGLEVLRVIGTDTALMQLNGVAQKVKFQGIKKRAKEMMEAIASDRKMSRAELEDRIVPDLDLDEKGGRTLDFGPRQFRVMLGPDLSPVIKDEDGKIRKDLPKPNSKDDEVKANAATADWKLLKKQLRETLKLQAPRLENAMTAMRRWSVADFQQLFVKHPLLTNLTKRLVWAGYNEKQQQAVTFRINEEGETTDASDSPLSLDGVAGVGIVHPLHLSEPDKQAWGQLFADYEIIPPFPQLGRPVYTLTAEEKKQNKIDRLKGKKIEAIVLHSILEKCEWVRGTPQDGGWFHDHSKMYDNAGLTAVIEYDPGMGVGYMMDSGDQEVQCVYFLKTAGIKNSYYLDDKEAVILSTIDPVILSEVLRTLEVIGHKEKS